jgi:Fic family protein
MDLGAIQSKIEHVANALLPPEVARKLQLLYLAKGVHATTAIEGNTLSEEEVRDRIDKKTTLPESKSYLGQEIDNIVKACNAIWNQIFNGKDTSLSLTRIKAFNRLILDGLPLEKEVVPGKIRRHSVGVANYRGAPWKDCDFLVERLCEWLNAEFSAPHAELTTGFSVLRAIMAHLYIAWIHPFGDGNGRTARLVEFQILLSGRVPTIAAHLLSNFYNQTRLDYYRSLEAARSQDGPLKFLMYAMRGLRDSLDEQIKRIRVHQWDVAWRDYVYREFRGKRGDAVERRRLLALELANSDQCLVPIRKLPRITAELAELYAHKTIKTLTRDVHELEQMKLVVREGKDCRVNGAILSELLSPRKENMVNTESAPT